MNLTVTLVAAYLVFLAFGILVWFTAGAGEPLAAAILIGVTSVVVTTANWVYERWFA